jgi:phosphotransferase system enzyme I (PtsP)
MARSNFPDREDQYQLYKKVVEEFSGDPVTIRTLDIGGDKTLPYFKQPKEDNPFMGWRSVRISLDNQENFQTQIEAILMAARHGPIRLLFPMISNMEEIRSCKNIVQDAMKNLQSNQIPFAEDVPIGAMIEVPAAVQLAPHLAKEVDFFALGTNDLIQYTIAVDRGNELVAYLYEPTHPAVLKLIKMTINAAHAKGIWVGLCGQMAADPLMTGLLLGMGVDELSVTPRAVPLVKDTIRSLTSTQSNELAVTALSCKSAAEVLNLCRKLTEKVAPEILELI